MNMKRRFKLLVLLIGVLMYNLCDAQVKPVFVSDSLDQYIIEAMQKWQIPGVAVGVVKDGTVILEKGFGELEKGSGNRVDEHSLFMIGSNTKAFVGTSLALLEFENNCKLSDKVIDYVPGFKLYESQNTSQVNLIDIVSHRLGFGTFQGDFMYFDSDFTNDELLDKISKVEPLYDFRTTYGYCNEGYSVAGMCIEKISGKNWQELLKERILTPLEMDRTVTSVPEMSKASNACTGYTLDKFKVTEIGYGGLDLLGPAASISSSVHDMNKWTTMLLDSGRFEGKQIIDQKVIDRTRQPQTITGKGRHPFNKTNFRLYGLGWGLSDYESYQLISHTGGVHGFVTSVTLVPEMNLGIVVLTNTDHNWFYDALKWEILDAYMGLPKRNYSNLYHGWFAKRTQADSLSYVALRDSVSMKIKPELSLKKFAGTYVSEVYGNAEFTVADGYLSATFEHHPALTAKLEYIGNDRFLCTYSNAAQGVRVFPFVLEGNQVKSFTLSVASYLEYTTYDFTKLGSL